MRLFQHQSVYTPSNETHPPVPAPAPPPPPPFLTDAEEERGLWLLKESSSHLREGRQRLPTPDKVAIMELSCSFDKRRLGKQQQILSEITQRCREQEVTDLSSKISAKVLLQKTEDSHDAPPFMAAAAPSRPRRSAGRRPGSNGSLVSSEDLLRENEAIERRLNFEKGYKFFPARRIIRHPCRANNLFQPPGSRNGCGGGPEAGYPYRETGTAPFPGFRMGTDLELEPRAHTVEGGKAPGTIQSYLQPKLDAVPPLLLADLHGSSSSAERPPQDRVGYFFSPSRLPLSQRSRTYFHSHSRVGGRPFQAFAAAGARPSGKEKEKGGARGLHTMIQRILTDMDSGGRGGQPKRRGGLSREVTLHANNSSPVRVEGQKVQ